MTKTRLWSGGAIVAALLLVISAWFLLIAPQRSEASGLRQQAVVQQSSNDQIQLKTAQLKAQFASLPDREAQLAEIKQQMPNNPALPALIRDLSLNAEAAGVSLQTVSPGAPTALVPAVGLTAATAASPLQSVQTKITVTGTYPELTLYLQKLQSTMRRAILIEDIALAPGQGTGATTSTGSLTGTSAPAAAPTTDLQMIVNGKIFVLADTPVASTAVLPVPTPSATATPAN